jgi:hypothetical protein
MFILVVVEKGVGGKVDVDGTLMLLKSLVLF